MSKYLFIRAVETPQGNLSTWNAVSSGDETWRVTTLSTRSAIDEAALAVAKAKAQTVEVYELVPVVRFKATTTVQVEPVELEKASGGDVR